MNDRSFHVLVTYCLLMAFPANCKGALEEIVVPRDTKNVTVTVPLRGTISITWFVGPQPITKVVWAISNASYPVARLKDGGFVCYKQGFFSERECQEHFQLTVNASSDQLITAIMRNLSNPYFERFLISVYRGPDSNIDTLWIIVSKKELPRQPELAPKVPSAKSNGTVKTNISWPSEFTGYGVLVAFIVVPILENGIVYMTPLLPFRDGSTR
ncbi:hypothetical protein AWC38_SpisGene1240 [Stylophora pistillata]|uniref:Uncharacterized protein n=1 Tax=Stylophora pistillata TaxID=50429 RepID=A0A2B4SZD1_STYPI|nr:hypothetical protein AWC38_SpisGene1240 [Stylophora pistillata]